MGTTKSLDLTELYGRCEHGFIDTHAHIHYIMDQQKVSSFAELESRFTGGRGRGRGGTSGRGGFGSGPLFLGVINVYCDAAAMSPSFGTWATDLEHPLCWGSFGFHPHSAKWYTDEMEERIIDCLKHPKAVAWGECGLDYGKNPVATPEEQRAVFARQVRAAVTRTGKPIVVHLHGRKTHADAFEVLLANMPKDWKVHLHCFSGEPKELRRFVDTFPNMYYGMTGSITYGDQVVKEALARAIPFERLLFESDAPYMAPSPLGKGDSSHPGHIPYIADHYAKLTGRSLNDVLAQVRENTKELYGI